MHIHVSIDAVLLHRVCEVSDSLRRGPQPGLDLRQVQNHLPVGPLCGEEGVFGTCSKDLVSGLARPR